MLTPLKKLGEEVCENYDDTDDDDCDDGDDDNDCDCDNNECDHDGDYDDNIYNDGDCNDNTDCNHDGDYIQARNLERREQC